MNIWTVHTFIYKLICTYINMKGEIPGICSLKDGNICHSWQFCKEAFGAKLLYTQNGKDTTTGGKTCQVLTSHLFETRGGSYWDRESRRLFQRRMGPGLLVPSKLSPGRQKVPPPSSSSEPQHQVPVLFSSWVGWGRTVPNPPPVFLAQSPCPLPGALQCCSPSQGPVLWEAVVSRR